MYEAFQRERPLKKQPAALATGVLVFFTKANVEFTQPAADQSSHESGRDGVTA